MALRSDKGAFRSAADRRIFRAAVMGGLAFPIAHEGSPLIGTQPPRLFDSDVQGLVTDASWRQNRDITISRNFFGEIALWFEPSKNDPLSLGRGMHNQDASIVRSTNVNANMCDPGFARYSLFEKDEITRVRVASRRDKRIPIPKICRLL